MRQKHRNERGSALIAVLCLIFTGGLIAASVLALSQTGTYNIAAHVERQRSMLIAEGAANRIQWLLAADRSLYPSENPGETDYTLYEGDRYVGDGVYHELDYYGDKLRFCISDAVSGYDFSSSNYTTALNIFTSQDKTESDYEEIVARVKDRIADYLDSDDEVREEGAESSEYEELGAAPLPRNDAMQFREELLWIQEFTDLVPVDKMGRLSAVRLMPNDDTGDVSGKPNLFNATADQIRLIGGFEEEDVPDIMEALEKWRTERVLLSESLEEEQLTKLKSVFATAESGIFTITIEASPAEPRPWRRLVFSFTGFGITGPTDKNVKYYEWSFF